MKFVRFMFYRDFTSEVLHILFVFILVHSSRYLQGDFKQQEAGFGKDADCDCRPAIPHPTVCRAVSECSPGKQKYIFLSIPFLLYQSHLCSFPIYNSFRHWIVRLCFPPLHGVWSCSGSCLAFNACLLSTVVQSACVFVCFYQFC